MGRSQDLPLRPTALPALPALPALTRARRARHRQNRPRRRVHSPRAAPAGRAPRAARPRPRPAGSRSSTSATASSTIRGARAAVLNQLGHQPRAGNQVGHRVGVEPHEGLPQPVGQRRQLVDHHHRTAVNRALHGGRARRGDGDVGRGEHRVGAVAGERPAAGAAPPPPASAARTAASARCGRARHDELHVLEPRREPRHRLGDHRHQPLELVAPAAGQQRHGAAAPGRDPARGAARAANVRPPRPRPSRRADGRRTPPARRRRGRAALRTGRSRSPSTRRAAWRASATRARPTAADRCSRPPGCRGASSPP